MRLTMEGALDSEKILTVESLNRIVVGPMSAKFWSHNFRAVTLDCFAVDTRITFEAGLTT
ncbi:MAG: hypothetical protein ACP5U1_14150 [Desulfomonilaceae bacterium]